MGTTIRRQPVKFDIPKSPDYKFLNITNFRGLDISSNPFELATNTASDCLNVYVDETNTLTTRPRLEKKLENLFVWQTPDSTRTIIDVQPLSDGYFMHGRESYQPTYDVARMFYIKNGIRYKIEPAVATNLPKTKCLVFEKDDKVYILSNDSENSYWFFNKNDVGDGKVLLYAVEPYLPVVDIIGVGKTTMNVENLNLLTSQYKQAEFWDGFSKLQMSAPPSYADLFTRLNNDVDLNDAIIVKVYSDMSMWLYKLTTVSERTNRGVIYFAEHNSDGTYTLKSGITANFPWTMLSSTGEYTYYYPIAASEQTKTLYWYDVNNKSLNKITAETYTTTPIATVLSNQLEHIKVSQTGDHIITINGGSDVVVYDSSGTNIVSTLKSDLQHSLNSAATYSIIDVADSASGGASYVTATELIGSESTTIVAVTHDGKTYEKIGKLKTVVFSTYQSYTTQTGTKFACLYQQQHNKDVWSIGVYNGKELLSRNYNKPPQNININDAGMCYVTLKDVVNQSEIRFMSVDDLSDTTELLFFSNNSTSSHNAIYYSPGNYMVFERQPSNQLDIFKMASLDEPVIGVTTLRVGDEEYAQWLEKHNELFASKLLTRFNNEYWLGAGNRYYRSLNNDPTYFPITEYNDLGDSNEDITGFNLANDTTLIAYKKNNIFLIQPFTSSSDTTEYTITESKNTVGNTAIGAPIVTTLTEIPLQINNDGIYGLSQMANVSSTERIADLISGPINERWLDIPEQYIANVKTLNRLYWTYIVMPRPDKNNTWIYILDNRTNSWYYWELPIVAMNAFAKDNRAEFVDTNGDIYYLTTEDIINKAFETLVTEYYDVGNKLIPWYWQSQILPLGTMNYSKRLVNTTFVLTDDDNIDGYGLNYSFKVFRKLASSVADTEISGDLNLVRSTTKKTNISRFGFIQLKLSNIDRVSDDGNDQTIKAYRNNKLRLVGLGLKYVLLEGLIK